MKHDVVRVDNLMYKGCEPHWGCKRCGEIYPFHCYSKEEFEKMDCKEEKIANWKKHKTWKVYKSCFLQKINSKRVELGDGIGRNKGVAYWIYRRQTDYRAGAEDFIEWLCNKYEVFEPEDDEYALYGDMKYHSKEELLDEFKTEMGID